MINKDFDLLVIGETLVEFSCESDLIPCETFKKDIGGADVVVAATAARLGGAVQMLTAIAQDPFEDFIRERLLSQGINIDAVPKDCIGFNGLYMTSSKYPESREYLVHHPGTANRHILPELVNNDMVERSKIVYASSELQSVSRETRLAIFKAFHYANSHGVTVAYDPNLRLHRWSLDYAREYLWNVLALVDVIFISTVLDDTAGSGEKGEAMALTGYYIPFQVISYLWDRGVDTVVVKAGAQGCWVGYRNNGEHGEIKHFPQPVVGDDFKNSTLLGSAFNGAFLYAYACNYTPFEAATFANAAALFKGIKGNGIDSLPTQGDALPV